jgi:hypothetical protein
MAAPGRTISVADPSKKKLDNERVDTDVAEIIGDDTEPDEKT